MRSLFNKRILVTRSRHQASELAVQLEALGATAVLIPTIEIVPPETFAPLDAAIMRLNCPAAAGFDWMLFTSANAVEAFHQRRTILASAPIHTKSQAAGPDMRSPAAFPKVAVIGSATARAVRAIGLEIDLIPPQYVAESLAASLKPLVRNSNVLLIRAAQARDILPVALTAAGARLTIADAYRNQVPTESISALQTVFASPATCPDAITFTSASTARNLFDLLEAACITLPPGTALVSIGPITSQTLRELGHPPTSEAATPTIPSLVESLVAHLNGTGGTLTNTKVHSRTGSTDRLIG